MKRGHTVRFPQVVVGKEGSNVDDRSKTIGSLEAGLAELEPVDVVLCGTFREDLEGLTHAFNELRDLGCRILAPGTAESFLESDEFLDADEEQIEASERLQRRHLETIQHARFMWLHCPRGYVGPTTALEIGFARASGLPVFSVTPPQDIVLQKFVRLVTSPRDVILKILHHELEPPSPALQTIQYYYRRAAAERGYEIESAQECLLLMVEELSELARALRKRDKVVRHKTSIHNQEAIELADIFIYLVRMANILHLDLSKAVQNKEILNIKQTIRV
jgi:NTP pyrophosphatase (non-canonical NTP hydrolase)